MIDSALVLTCGVLTINIVVRAAHLAASSTSNVDAHPLVLLMLIHPLERHLSHYRIVVPHQEKTISGKETRQKWQ